MFYERDGLHFRSNGCNYLNDNDDIVTWCGRNCVKNPLVVLKITDSRSCGDWENGR